MKKSKKYFIEKYLQNRPLFFSLIRPLEADFFQKTKKLIHSPSLDFGCGDGFFAQVTFGKRKIDIGLDLEKNQRVNETIKNKVYKKTILYDGKKIPFKNNYFKTIISNCVLEHIPDLEFSLKEIYRVMKQNGFFITSVMADNWEKYLFGKKIFGKFYLSFMRKKQEHYHLFSLKKWQKIFEKTGFRVVKVYPYLNSKQAIFLDLFHYLSFPSLFSYIFFKKWVIFPKWYKFLKVENFIDKILKEKTTVKKSAALFFVLKKI